jgi:hypothetical protein
MDKHMEITNGSNYDASCTLISLLVLDFENFKHLIFVAQSVHEQRCALRYLTPSHYSQSPMEAGYFFLPVVNIFRYTK